jgi:hypothetical protein
LARSASHFLIPHDPFWHIRIDRSGADFDARCNLGGRKLLGVGLTDEGLRTTGVVSGLFFVWDMDGNIPDIRIFLDHGSLLSPDRLWSFVAAVPGLVHVPDPVARSEQGAALSDRGARPCANKRPPERRPLCTIFKFYLFYRTSDVSELVKATGLPALMTRAVWV